MYGPFLGSLSLFPSLPIFPNQLQLQAEDSSPPGRNQSNLFFFFFRYSMEPYVENQFQSQPSNSGLLRFRSAATTLFSSFGGGVGKGISFAQSSPDKSIPRFLSTAAAGAEYSSSLSFETKPFRVPSVGYSGLESNQLPLQFPKPGICLEVGPFRIEGSRSSLAVNQSTQQGKGFGGVDGSNLTRQNSSPVGFLAHLNAPDGCDMTTGGGGVGNIRLGCASNGEAPNPSSSRLKGRMDFASGLSCTSLGHLPRIPEIGAESTKESSPDGGHNNNGYRNGEDDDARFYGGGFTFASWNHCSSSMTLNSSALKAHPQQNDSVLCSGSDAPAPQSGGVTTRAHMLSHHLSLPKTSAEMSAAEKLLNFHDIVPCKIRAKRGCATHPRSIAERVRRSRISERMKNLQELVPNLDKQINTADMLDVAVNYIKDLQKQHKILSDSRARCRCLNA